MKLFLVRHGETPWNRDNLIMGRSNPSLSTLGQVQAEALGRVLGQLDGVEAIYSSPLARAMETAKAISLPLGFPVNIHDGLAELDIGPLEGMTSEERLVRYPEFSASVATPSCNISVKRGIDMMRGSGLRSSCAHSSTD